MWPPLLRPLLGVLAGLLTSEAVAADAKTMSPGRFPRGQRWMARGARSHRDDVDQVVEPIEVVGVARV